MQISAFLVFTVDADGNSVNGNSNNSGGGYGIVYRVITVMVPWFYPFIQISHSTLVSTVLITKIQSAFVL